MMDNQSCPRQPATVLSGLLSARGLPPVDPATPWAQLAAQLCHSPAGFIVLAANQPWRIISDAALTRTQQVAADAASRHVMRRRSPGLFTGVRPLPFPVPPNAGPITIAAPIVMPCKYASTGAIGVLDVAPRHQVDDLEILTAICEAYGWLVAEIG